MLDLDLAQSHSFSSLELLFRNPDAHPSCNGKSRVSRIDFGSDLQRSLRPAFASLIGRLIYFILAVGSLIVN